MSTPPDWTKFYQQNLSGGVSTDSSADNSSARITSGPSGSNLSPEGRVSKPARRRSRASRRTPTTLLNTDTTNFRAMVQQFTGGHFTHFPSAPPHPPAATNFSFGRQVHPSHLIPPGYRLQYQQPQHQSQHQNNQGYMISLSSMNNPGAGIGDGFFQRLGGSLRPPNTEASDGFLMEMNVPRSPTTASGSNENRGNGFMF